MRGPELSECVSECDVAVDVAVDVAAHLHIGAALKAARVVTPVADGERA